MLSVNLAPQVFCCMLISVLFLPHFEMSHNCPSILSDVQPVVATTECTDIFSTANCLQEPGTAQPSVRTTNQPAATPQLGDPSALHHCQHQQEDSH